MTDSANALSIPAGFLQAGAQAFLPGSQTGTDRTYRLTALISTPQVPFRLVGLDTQLYLDQDHDPYFFFQDSRRSYWVENQLFYNRAGALQPVTASDPGTPPWTALHVFHVFYHPFTRLFSNQLASGGFDALYDANLQQNADQIGPGGTVAKLKTGSSPDTYWPRTISTT